MIVLSLIKYNGTDQACWQPAGRLFLLGEAPRQRLDWILLATTCATEPQRVVVVFYETDSGHLIGHVAPLTGVLFCLQELLRCFSVSLPQCALCCTNTRILNILHTDIGILGAGPAGAAAALRLSTLGIPCVVVDKAAFPRPKVCGDAISGKVTTLLHRMDPDMLRRFDAQPVHTGVWGIRFVAPNRKVLDIPFGGGIMPASASAPGYVCRRTDFDYFLVQEMKRRPSITLLENTDIQHVEKIESGYSIATADLHTQIHCQLLLVANGAHSAFSRKAIGLHKDPAHHAASVRAYFEGVGGMHPQGFIELHFLRPILPGYFWIFPLPDGRANVGLGIRSDVVGRKRLNLRQVFQELIYTHPGLRERFAHARQEGPLEGYGLPLGSKPRPISGDHYLLLGDAGHLIDPLTGEGIGNAFYSGIIAAEQAQRCLEAHNFSADFLKAYDQRVARVLGSEMQLSYRLQRLLAWPAAASLMANIIAGNSRIVHAFTRMYTDFELRMQLVNPLFWLRMMWRKH